MISVYRFALSIISVLLSWQSFAQINSPYNNNTETVPTTKSKEEQIDTTKKSATKLKETSSQSSDKQSYEAVQTKYESSYNSYSTNPNRRSMTDGEKSELTNYLDQMSKLDPENWLNFLAYYQIGQHDISRYPALKKVENQKTKDKDLLNQVIAYDAITANENRLREDLVQMKKTDFFSSDMYQYAEDVLLSCENGSLLITHGFEDTHTALYVQKVMRKKTEVEIIDLDWFNSSFYRSVLEGKGYRLPKDKLVDVAYLNAFCMLNADKAIHLALTLAKPYLNGALPFLYVQGLTFRYSPLTLELSTKNMQLWEEVLTKSLLEDCGSALSVNYLPILYQLRQTQGKTSTSVETYSKKLKSSSSDEFDQLIQKIVREQNLPTSLNK